MGAMTGNYRYQEREEVFDMITTGRVLTEAGTAASAHHRLAR